MKTPLIALAVFFVAVFSTYLRYGSITPCGILTRRVYEEKRGDVSFEFLQKVFASSTPWECARGLYNGPRAGVTKE